MKKNKNLIRLSLLGLMSTQLLVSPVGVIASEVTIEDSNAQKATEESESVQITYEKDLKEQAGTDIKETPILDSSLLESDKGITASKEDSKGLQITKGTDETKMVKQVKNAETKIETDTAIDSTNFPDPVFRAYIKTNFDTNNDGVLSPAEIAKVLNIKIIGADKVKNIEGVKIFSNLQTLFVSFQNLTEIDVAGMANLTSVSYEGISTLQTLDFRDCFNLTTAFHPRGTETIYVSPGMTKFIGCNVDSKHTGNIVMDITGFYTVNADGTKVVDLSSILSPVLIREFEKTVQPGYDSSTQQLTIPAEELQSEYKVGVGISGAGTKWTFNTQSTVTNSYVVTFDSQNGEPVYGQVVVAGELSKAPTTIPLKDGYEFLGWYTSSDCVTAADFSQPIVADVTYYAKWKELTEDSYVVTFDTQGGTLIDEQVVVSGELSKAPVTPPTKEGYEFSGWYRSLDYTTAVDFSQAIAANTTYYAKWAPIAKGEIQDPATPKRNKKVAAQKTLPQTGEEQTPVSIVMGSLLMMLSAVIVFGKKNVRFFYKN